MAAVFFQSAVLILVLVQSTKNVDFKLQFQSPGHFQFQFQLVDENLMNFSFSFSHFQFQSLRYHTKMNAIILKLIAHLITGVSIVTAQSAYLISIKASVCYYCSITVLLSAEQHAHFRGKLRSADEKQRQNVDEKFTHFSFSFRLVVEFLSQFQFRRRKLAIFSYSFRQHDEN